MREEQLPPPQKKKLHFNGDLPWQKNNQTHLQHCHHLGDEKIIIRQPELKESPD